MNFDCPVDTSSSKTARQHTQLVPRRTTLLVIVNLLVNCPDFIAKEQWPPNSTDLNPLDYHIWEAMLEAYHKRHPKPKTIAELEEVLQVIWDSLPQGPIDKVSKSSQRDWRPVLQLRVDISNIHSNCNGEQFTSPNGHLSEGSLVRNYPMLPTPKVIRWLK